MVAPEGWGAVRQPLAVWSEVAPALAPWTHQPYNYPPLILVFFRLVVAVWPTVFAVKLILTLLESLNAWLVWRLTACRWTAAAYWCLPLSVWWTSREAQIEPLQNSLMLAALLAVREGRAAGFAAWSAAGLVKLGAVLLAPWFLAAWWRRAAGWRWRALGWALVALLPLAVAAWHWPVFAQTFSTVRWEVNFNLWHWRAVFDRDYHGWAPLVLTVWIRAATLVLLVSAAWFAWRGRFAPAALASLGLFLALSATMGVFQGWYFCAVLPCVLLACDRKARLVLLLLVQLCEPLSVFQLAVRPVGWGGRNELVGVATPVDGLVAPARPWQ